MQTKKKWKRWHVIVIAVCLLFIIGLITESKEKDDTPPISQATRDSLALAVKMEENKETAIVNLRMRIESSLNDPKSFDVLNQKAFLVGDSTIVVVLEYTAKNMFGGVVRKVVQAECDPDGNITKVFE
jgi:uncharacterized protein YehS (DUF1456 family)